MNTHNDARRGMLAWWLLLIALAAGCSSPSSNLGDEQSADLGGVNEIEGQQEIGGLTEVGGLEEVGGHEEVTAADDQMDDLDLEQTGETHQVTGIPVGPAGGTIEMEGGGSLTIPAGALAKTVEIMVAPTASPSAAPFSPAGPFFSFAPPGLAFAKAAVVRLPATSLVPETSVAWGDGAGVWQILESWHEPEAGLVVARVTHFSSGGAGAPGDEPATCCIGDSCSVAAPGACAGLLPEAPGCDNDPCAEVVCCDAGGTPAFRMKSDCQEGGGEAVADDQCTTVCCAGTDGAFVPASAAECSAGQGEPAVDSADCKTVCCQTQAGSFLVARGACLAGEGSEVPFAGCLAPPVGCASDADCDDFNPCTGDKCLASLCIYPPDVISPCDDGDDCTQQDVCHGGLCKGIPDPKCDTEEVCCQVKDAFTLLSKGECLAAGAVTEPEKCDPLQEVCCDFGGIFSLEPKVACDTGGVVAEATTCELACCDLGLGVYQIMMAGNCPWLVEMELCAGVAVCCNMAGMFLLAEKGECDTMGTLAEPGMCVTTCCDQGGGSYVLMEAGNCMAVAEMPKCDNVDVCCDYGGIFSIEPKAACDTGGKIAEAAKCELACCDLGLGSYQIMTGGNCPSVVAMEQCSGVEICCNIGGMYSSVEKGECDVMGAMAESGKCAATCCDLGGGSYCWSVQGNCAAPVEAALCEPMCGDGVPDGTGCNDGDGCTVGDSCQGGECTGNPKDCSDNNPETIDYCADGACVNQGIAGLPETLSIKKATIELNGAKSLRIKTNTELNSQAATWKALVYADAMGSELFTVLTFNQAPTSTTQIDFPLPHTGQEGKLDIFDPQIEFMIDYGTKKSLDASFWVRLVEVAGNDSRKSALTLNGSINGMEEFYWELNLGGSSESDDPAVDYMLLRAAPMAYQGFNDDADGWEVVLYDWQTQQELAFVPAEYVGTTYHGPGTQVDVGPIGGGIIKFSVLRTDWGAPEQYGSLQAWGFVRVREKWTLPGDTGARMSAKWENTFKVGGYFK